MPKTLKKALRITGIVLLSAYLLLWIGSWFIYFDPYKLLAPTTFLAILAILGIGALVKGLKPKQNGKL